MLANSIRERLETDLAEIIGAERLYIVLASETSSKVGDNSWGGLFDSNMAAQLRDDIGDRWQGVGPAMWIRDTWQSEAEIVRRSVAYAVHEAAHAVDLGWSTSDAPASTAEVVQLRRTIAAEVTCLEVERLPTMLRQIRQSVESQLCLHPPAFLRILLHIAHRMQLRDWAVDLDRTHAWNLYGVNCCRLSQIIGPELTALESRPLSVLMLHELQDGWLEAAVPSPDHDTVGMANIKWLETAIEDHFRNSATGETGSIGSEKDAEVGTICVPRLMPVER